MRKCLLFYLILILSLILFTSDASAYVSPYTIGLGAKATSMGGAFVAIADDPSAIYYNPAGLTQLKGTNITVGHSVISPHIVYRDSGEYQRVDDPIDSMYYPYVAFCGDLEPLHGLLRTESLVFGVAALLPYGEIFRLQVKPAEQKRLSWYQEEFKRVLIYPGLGYQVTPKLSVGLSLGIEFDADLALGMLGFAKGDMFMGLDLLKLLEGKLFEILHEIEIKYFEITSLSSPDLKVDLDAWWIHTAAGLLYKPTEGLSVGLVYRGEVLDTIPLELGGIIYADLVIVAMVEPAMEMLTIYLEDHPIVIPTKQIFFKYIKPQQAVFGIAYKPIDRLTLACDLTWTQWSIVEANGGWKDTYVPKFGLEYRPARTVFGMELAWRAGYFYEPSPIPEEAFANEYVDFDKFVYSAGLGLRNPKYPFKVDLYVQLSHLKNRRVYKPPVIGGSGEYEFAIVEEKDFVAGESVYNTGFTVTYHF